LSRFKNLWIRDMLWIWIANLVIARHNRHQKHESDKFGFD
jgi:hypothetical protein